jgi:small subunit ribosomal protein S20
VANIKSQIKRIRTNEKRRLRNKAVKSELKTYVRRTREAIEAQDAEAAAAALRDATRKLDKAVSKGVIHRNQAANRKSSLAQQVAKLAAAPAPAAPGPDKAATKKAPAKAAKSTKAAPKKAPAKKAAAA